MNSFKQFLAQIESSKGCMTAGVRRSDHKLQHIRWCLIVMAYNEGLSFNKIGHMFNMNHTSIMHVIKTRMHLTKDSLYISLAKKRGIQNKDQRPLIQDLSDSSLSKSKYFKLYKDRGYKCEVCGFDDFVEVHHIHGRLAGSHPNNLIILCPNHHTQLHMGALFINKKNFSVDK